MALTDAVPSDSLDVLKRNAADLDKALNSTSSFQNRVGDTLLPVPAALAQLPNAVTQALSDIQSDVNTVESEKSAAVSAIQTDVNAVDTRRDSAIDEIVDDIAATHAQKGLAFSEINQDRALVRDKRSEAITDINGYVDEVEARKNQAILTDIPAKVAELGLNYPPIEYASGLTLSDYTQTYVYNNVIYTWGGALGTVTTGAFDEGSWNLVQQVFGGNMFYDAREHITDYTGATPQYQELQEAIDAAVLNGFSRLYLGDGTILLTELDSSAGGVEIPSQITEVFGSGMGATILKWTDSNASGTGRRDAIKVANGYSGELLNLNNFTLHGPREAVINTFDGNPSFGVNATGGGTRLIVEKVEAKYCRNQAISASDWDEVEYSSNRLWHNGRGGLCTRQCRRFNAHHNVIVANGDDSIFALQADNVANDQSSHAINISDNIIIQSQGIRLLSVKSANVCDNIIEKPLGFGVFAGSIFGDYVEGNCASVGLNISGNLITDCLDRGQLDAFNGANQYIMIESTTPASQTNGIVPGRSDTTTGDVQEPQPWFWTTVDNDSDPAYGNAGTWFTTLENNTLLSTLDTSLSWGEQGGLPFWGNDGVVSNIDVTEELLQCEGVQLSGYVNRLKITGGRIAVRNKQGILFSDVNEDFAIMDSVISNVSIERSVDYPAIDTSFSSTDKNIDLVIRDCTIDVDPWHEAGARNADGSWISGSVTSTAIDANRALGVKVVSNTFKNCYQAVRGPVSTFVALNIAVCQPAALGYNASNKGMGVIPTTGGYTHEAVNSDPTSADFRKVLTLPLSDSAAKPTGGTYVQGAFVKNSQPTPTSPVLGWLRLTTGSAHVEGVDWQEVVAGGEFKGSTTDLINANADFSAGDVITTTGFSVAGDAGGAQWKATATTGLTPSQTPADRGAAELVDGSGRLWELVGSAIFLEQLGAVLDGLTSNNGVVSAAVNWSNSTGGRIYLGIGTLLCSGIALVSLKATIRGINRDLSIIKLADGTNNNVISMTGTSELDIKNVTLDGNRANQTGGHGIRGGGCNKMHIDSVTIKDCYSYGIGFQAGTNKNVKINNLITHSTGQDGIDIKDYNSDNDTIFISNFHAYNYGLLTDQQVGLDIRGHVVATNIVLEPSKGTNNYGFRVRPSSVQGRAGSGSITNLTVIGDGVSSDHIALDIASDSGDLNITGVNAKDFFLAMRLEGATTGGNINSVSASGIYGTDCMSIGGTGWLINGLKVENTSGSSRVFDVEPGAQNIRMTNVNLTDNSTNASSARIQAGASNIQIDGGFVTGGAIADNGTDSVVNVTYL